MPNLKNVDKDTFFGTKEEYLESGTGKIFLYLEYPFVRYALIVGVLIAVCQLLISVIGTLSGMIISILAGTPFGA